MKISDMKNFLKSTNGQATVELAVMFPIVIIIAVICINALTFFAECSLFDRTFKQIVTCTASSPAYGTNAENIASQVEAQIKDKFNKDFLDFEIRAHASNEGLYSFLGTIKMHPTLFGLGLRDEIFGVPMISLNHEQTVTIDMYKPGIIF